MHRLDCIQVVASDLLYKKNKLWRWLHLPLLGGLAPALLKIPDRRTVTVSTGTPYGGTIGNRSKEKKKTHQMAIVSSVVLGDQMYTCKPFFAFWMESLFKLIIFIIRFCFTIGQEFQRNGHLVARQNPGILRGVAVS